MGGVREIATHGSRSATGRIARVVHPACKKRLACRRPRSQVGGTRVILTTSEAGMMCRAVVSATTTAAGWALLVQAAIPRRSLSMKDLSGAAGLQEPPPSFPQVEHFSPQATPYVPGTPGAAWSEQELRDVRAKIYRIINEGNQVFHELGLQAGSTSNRASSILIFSCLQLTVQSLELEATLKRDVL